MKRRVEVLGSTAMSGRTLAATLVATGAIVLASGGAAQARTVGCRPPRGPGDSQVHSADVQAHNITCATARRIMLKCAGFSYGHSGMCRVAGRRWWCFSA